MHPTLRCVCIPLRTYLLFLFLEEKALISIGRCRTCVTCIIKVLRYQLPLQFYLRLRVFPMDWMGYSWSLSGEKCLCTLFATFIIKLWPFKLVIKFLAFKFIIKMMNCPSCSAPFRRYATLEIARSTQTPLATRHPSDKPEYKNILA